MQFGNAANLVLIGLVNDIHNVLSSFSQQIENICCSVYWYSSS